MGWSDLEPTAPVVVGVDGSAYSLGALDWAAQEAARHGWPLVAVYAWHQPAHWPEGWPIRADEEWFQADVERVLHESTSRWSIQFPEVKLTSLSDVDHPAVALARRATAADLVVIGGRGHGTVTGMLLGSVARATLRQMDRPVAVVHRPEES